jgi:hypothetical protein
MISLYDILRVLLVCDEDVPTPQCRGYVKTYVIDVNPSRTPDEGTHSLSWLNRLSYHRHHHLWPVRMPCKMPRNDTYTHGDKSRVTHATSTSKNSIFLIHFNEI